MTVADLIDPAIMFADEHEGDCCSCCKGYCVLAEAPAPWFKTLRSLTVAGAECLTDGYALIRSDALGPLPEGTSVLPMPDVDPDWATIPDIAPKLSTHRQSPWMLDRLDRAGLACHDSGDEKVVHLYHDGEHVGWVTHAREGRGVTVDELPTIRTLAQEIGVSVDRAARALEFIREVVGKEIKEAIESKYLGPDSGRLPDGRDAPDAAQRNAYDEGLEVAARIAYQASRGIGGGA